MRLLIAAGRHLEDAALIRRALMRAHAIRPITVVIHGSSGRLGAITEEWARAQHLHVVRYPANWRAFGKRAGLIRNAFMLEDARPDMVLALPGGSDTRDLIARAHSARVPVIGTEGTALRPDAQDEPEPEPALTCAD